MIWIFPIAGHGTRTKDHGKFKPFIKIGNKTLIEHCGENLPIKPLDTCIFLYSMETAPGQLEDTISKFDFLKDVTVLFSSTTDVLNGPAETVLANMSMLISSNKSIYRKYNSDELRQENVIVVNCDQIVSWDIKLVDGCSGYMPVYYNSTGSSCYVKTKKDGTITKIKEKKLISNNASAGVYQFGSLSLMMRCLWWHKNTSVGVTSKFSEDNELFIGPSMWYINKCTTGQLLACGVNMKLDLGSSSAIDKHKSFFKQIQNEHNIY